MFISTKRQISLVCLGVVLLSLFLLRPSTTLALHEHVSNYYNSYLGTPSRPESLFCPSVYAQNASLPYIDHAQQECTPVNSKLPEFAAALCRVPDSCNAFTLRIWRTSELDCGVAEGAQDPFPSALSEVTQWMRRERGPDSFYVRTDGAQRTGTVYNSYEGNCNYIYDIQLRNPGDVYLQAWWTEEVSAYFLFFINHN